MNSTYMIDFDSPNVVRVPAPCVGGPLPDGRMYGVSLSYVDNGKNVRGMSSFPVVSMDNKTSSPIQDASNAFSVYQEGMRMTLDKLDDAILDLSRRRDALAYHLELSNQLGCIAPVNPKVEP